MRPLHVAALGAVALVALLVWLTRDDGTARTQRGAAPVHTERDGLAPTDEPAPDKPAGGVRITILDPAGRPADGAHIEVRGPADRTLLADARGVAALGDLPLGHYDLLARRGDACGGRPFERANEGPLDLGTLTLTDGVRVTGRVRGAGGSPVGDARVVALHAPRGPADLDPLEMVRRFVDADHVAAAATTDEEGRYELIVPRRPALALRASAPGYAPEFEPPRPWTLPAEDVDFALGGGRRVHGTVLGREDRPVAGARVRLVGLEAMLLGEPAGASMVTGADGRFDLTARASASLALVARAPGHAVHLEPELAAGSEVVVRLEPVWLVRLRVVAAAGGAPAPDVRVAAMRGTSFATGTTDDQGVARMELLQVRAAAGDPDTSWRIALAGSAWLPALESVEGARDEAARTWELGTLELERGGVCRGRVLDAVTDEPVAGARVRAGGGLSPDLVTFGRNEAVSDAEGRFELAGVPLEAHMLYALHPDYLADVDPARDLFGEPSESGSIFAPGEREAERDVRLRPAASVEGRVVDADGAPVAGAIVRRARADATSMATLVAGVPPSRAITGADGRFVLRGLATDRPTAIVAEHRDYALPPPVAARPGEPVTIRLRAGALLEGLVLGPAGQPVEGARVAWSTGRDDGSAPGYPVSRPPSVRPVLSDAEGRFVLRNLPVGEARVTVEHPAYRPRSEPVAVRPGDTRIELPPLRLDPGLAIEGLVVDGSGAPMAGVRVAARREGSDPIRARKESAVSGADGRFVLQGLDAGRWRLVVRHTASVSDEPVVEAGSAGVTLVVVPAVSFSGRVEGGGAPLERAEIRMVPVDAAEHDVERILWAWTDEQGRFTVTGLDPREAHRLRIRHEAFLPLEREEVMPGRGEETYRLEPGLALAGVVTDPAGAPVEDAIVVVERADGPADGMRYDKRAQSDAQGRFRVVGLAPGRYRVTARKPDDAWHPVSTEAAAGGPELRLEMRRAARLAGRVVGPGGGAPGPTVVTVLDANGAVVGSAYVFEQRADFAIGELDPGRYHLRLLRFDPDEPGGPAREHRTFGPFETGRTDLELAVDW